MLYTNNIPNKIPKGTNNPSFKKVTAMGDRNEAQNFKMEGNEEISIKFSKGEFLNP